MKLNQVHTLLERRKKVLKNTERLARRNTNKMSVLYHTYCNDPLALEQALYVFFLMNTLFQLHLCSPGGVSFLPPTKYLWHISCLLGPARCSGAFASLIIPLFIYHFTECWAFTATTSHTLKCLVQASPEGNARPANKRK